MMSEDEGYRAFIFLSLGEGRAIHYMAAKYARKYEKADRGQGLHLKQFWSKLEQKLRRFCNALSERADHVPESTMPEGSRGRPRAISQGDRD